MRETEDYSQFRGIDTASSDLVSKDLQSNRSLVLNVVVVVSEQGTYDKACKQGAILASSVLGVSLVLPRSPNLSFP